MWLGNRIRAACSLLLDGRYHVPMLVILSMLPYCRTLAVPFYFDDFAYVTQNPLIRDLGNYFADIPMPANILEDTYNNFRLRPLSYLTFSLNHLLHGPVPAGYHLVNLAIHAVNAVLVYFLVNALVAARNEEPPGANAGSFAATAFFTAALFAVHPVMTNAVTYITQRMTSLATLFYLAAMVMYARHQARAAAGRPAARPYLLALGCCCAAMLTKEIALTLPVMIVLFDLAVSRDPAGRRLLRLAPFVATMAIIPYLSLGLKHSETAQTSGKLLSAIHLVNFTGISPADYFLTQLKVVVFYLRLMVLPAGLSLEHQFPLAGSPLEPGVIGALLCHLFLAGCAVLLLRRPTGNTAPRDVRRSLAGYGILWFYLTLAVESSFIPITEPAVEYRLYLPAGGLLLSLVCLVHGACDRYRHGQGSPLAAGVLVAAVVACMGLTLARNEVWRDPEVFWMGTIRQYPFLGRPYANLADHYLRRKKLDDAIRTYLQAIGRLPDMAVLRYELGNAYLAAGRYGEAVRALNEAIVLDPGQPGTYISLAKAKCYLGEVDEAQRMFARAETLRQESARDTSGLFSGNTGSGADFPVSAHGTAAVPFADN